MKVSEYSFLHRFIDVSGMIEIDNLSVTTDNIMLSGRSLDMK